MSKLVDWRDPEFETKGTALYVGAWFYWKNANDWCEVNCIKRYYIFAEALMISWSFEAEIDSILFKLNWREKGREYYLILRDDNENKN